MSKLISASRMTELKAQVKAECQRRMYVGSVAEYASSSYDYTIAPANGVQIIDEHYTKIMAPLNAITTDESLTVPRVVSDVELSAAEAKIADLKTKPLYTTSLAETGCVASCTGLCYGSCTETCSGCSGECEGTCQGCRGCSGCGDACSTDCSGGCDGCRGCGSGCDGCSGCGNACSSGCGDACTGCSYTCHGSCTGDCQNTSVET